MVKTNSHFQNQFTKLVKSSKYHVSYIIPRSYLPCFQAAILSQIHHCGTPYMSDMLYNCLVHILVA